MLRVTRPLLTSCTCKRIRPSSSSQLLRIMSSSSSANQRLSMVSRHISSSPSASKAQASPASPLPTADDSQVIKTRSQNALRVLTLNRPKKLNSLNVEMITGMKPYLDAWESSDQVSVILFKGEGRAFCAGGDVELATEAAKKDETRHEAVEFFRSEYVLDNKIARMKTPIVTFMDGFTMGGGVGLSVHAPFRGAPENTLFAMPETKIGLFPDVGASFFLSRMDGRIGAYLGLTSANVDGWTAYQLGLATHYISSDRLAEVEDRLSGLTPQAEQTTDDVHAMINTVLDEFTAEPLDKKASAITGNIRKAIDTCFSHTKLSAVIADLKAVESGKLLSGLGLEAWATKTREAIEFRSPTSCAVTLLLLEDAVNFNIDDAFKTDMRIASAMDPSVHNDFIVGVHQVLVATKTDKKQRDVRPKWQPNSHTDEKALSPDVLRAKYFNADSPTKLPVPKHEAPQGGHRPYTKYPYAKFSLPTEARIARLVKGEDDSGGSFALSRSELHKVLAREYKNKTGLKEKVDEVLDRCTKTKGDTIHWAA